MFCIQAIEKWVKSCENVVVSFMSRVVINYITDLKIVTKWL